MSAEDLRLIAGSGGGGKAGGGTGGTPTEAKDNLESTAYAQIVDLLCEGEIEGFATPAKAGLTRGTMLYDVVALKDVFFDNTPVLNQSAQVREATYTQDATNIVLTIPSHGYSVGAVLQIYIASGPAVTSQITLTAVSTDNFTAARTNETTGSGNAIVAFSSDFNFKNIQILPRYGTKTQDIIPFAANISQEVGVGLTVEQGVPVTRTITDPNTDQVRVTITVPQLQEVTIPGDIIGSQVRLAISRQLKGGGFFKIIDDTIIGRTANDYQRDYMINLRDVSADNFPVDIRVERLTENSNSARLSNRFTWTSYTRIVRARLNYPHSALVGLRVDAEQFGSIPQRSYRIRGIKVPIPSNGTVDLATGRIIYSGVWNGTFGAAQWTTDPAWLLYALVTNGRAGFGTHVNTAQLDKWAFYAASQYCSELVPDGFGGQEPRFSCNPMIQAPEEAYKLINDMASVFRAKPFWGAGTVTLSQDRPADPAYLFTSANVTAEGFSYSGSDAKTRANVAVVQYMDLDARNTNYEQVEDRKAIERYGVIQAEITAFACTSRGQAARIGEWLIYANQQETEVINFTATLEAGVIVRPGQVIAVADPVRAGSRRGGRIVAATSTVITVDNANGLEPAGTLSVILPSGKLETRNCTRSGTAVTVSPGYSETPNVNSVWVYESSTIKTSLWRVLTVGEQDEINYAITALAYNPSKYDYIERDRPLQVRDVSNLTEPVAPPTNLQLTEALYEYQSQVRSKVLISWRPRVGVNQYRVRWRKDSANWQTATVQGPDYEILNTTPGLFEVEVYSIDALQRPSSTALIGSISALGKTAPPSVVTNFRQTIDPDIGILLEWDPVADLDLNDYELRRDGSSWDNATFVARVQSTSFKVGILESGSIVYRIKARDTSGVYSANEATRTVTVTAADAPVISGALNDPLLVLSWTTPRGSYAPAYYDLRYGASWSGGTKIAEVRANSFSLPVNWTGSRTFWVAAVDPVGTVGSAGSTSITITAAPAPSISIAFVNQLASLTWNAVNGSLQTRYYEISYGASFATRQVITRISSDGLGYSLSADWSGSRTFWVVAIDANGNYGTPGSTASSVVAPSPPSLTSTITGENVILTWGAVTGTLEVAYYEVRRGGAWDGGMVVGRVNATVITIKADWPGTQRFLVKAFDINGLSSEAAGIDVVINSPLQPSISQQVIDNNVLLRWNDCTATLPIVSYELRRGATWAGAMVIGTKQGGFTSVFETASGNYTYWLAGIDSAGNYGTPGSVSALVNQPPDYVLLLDQVSDFSGTKSNTYVTDSGSLLVAVNTTETYQAHFTSRSWTTPQAQINAGFPRYIMPSATSASYEQIVDYGSTVAGTKVSQVLTSNSVSGATTATPKISVRLTTGDAWTDYNNTSEVYATNFRYIKYRYDFSSSGGDDLLELTGLAFRLDAKLRNDFGTGSAVAGDSGGTTVNFGIDFVDVQSINVTPGGTAARYAIYDFVDVPNPTSFKVLLFDSSGNRVSGPFSWSARGV